LREAADRSRAYARRGLLLADAGRAEEAQRVLLEGCRRDPGNPEVLAALGRVRAKAERWAEALLAYGASLAASQDAAVKAEHDALQEKVKASTTEGCRVCAGAGRRTSTVTEAGVMKKVTQSCGTCRGSGKTWTKPCPACMTTVEGVYGIQCGTCGGRRLVLEALK
jgi:tetratricopeptide (TPR) repeat protein